MATSAKKSSSPSKGSALFTRENYTWMIIGAAVIALGFFLMAGGKSKDPNTFLENEVYSTTRITVAPILILVGIGLEIFAIFRHPKRNNQDTA